MRRSLLDLLAPVAAVLGLLFLAVGYGFLAAREGLFPASQLAAAEEALRSVWRAYLQPEWRATKGFSYDVPAVERAATVRDPARMAPGATFVVGYTAEGFGAWIVDERGQKLHQWRVAFSSVFPEPTHVQWNAGDKALAWHGAHLFPNGDILFNFQDNNFPYGSGLVKIDKDSKILWRLARNTHHDVTVAEDGTIWVPSLHYRAEGLPSTPQMKPWYYEDTILHLSPEGEILEEISILEAIAAGAPGLLSLNYRDDLAIPGGDAFHMNNVEPLPASMAAAFPMFEAGDLLVSLRNVNAAVVIDRETRQVKWVLTGPFAKQHDPDFLPNGHILVFDNQGGDPACGASRVQEIDPATQAVVWHYDGCGDPRHFHTLLRGMQQLLPNGNVLITEAQSGRVFEVTRDPQPAIVWDYFNILEQQGDTTRVGLVNHAERFAPGTLDFLSPPGS